MIVNRAPVKIVEAPQMAMRHVSQPIRHLRRHIPFANSPPSRIITCVASSKGFGSPEKALKPKQGREFVMPTLPCNCGSGKGYKNCCEPVHTGVKKASSPEATLRSRFSAYTLGLEEFIADSTHPDYLPFTYDGKTTEEAKEKYAQDIHTGCTMFDYQELTVKKSSEPGENENEGFVAFTYRSSMRPETDAATGAAKNDRSWKTTTEKARFIREGDVWKFADSQRFEYDMDALLKDKPQPVKN